MRIERHRGMIANEHIEIGSTAYDLYRSLNVVRVIKFGRLRWAGHVVRMEEGRSAFKI